eukprot:scaffold27005_cov132-Isochrysis_galbana.AAC.4
MLLAQSNAQQHTDGQTATQTPLEAIALAGPPTQGHRSSGAPLNAAGRAAIRDIHLRIRLPLPCPLPPSPSPRLLCDHGMGALEGYRSVSVALNRGIVGHPQWLQGDPVERLRLAHLHLHLALARLDV